MAMLLTQPAPPASPGAMPPSSPAARAVRNLQHAPAAALAPSPVPPNELSRITEHVLRTLDRRVLSYRERTGQI